MAELWPSDLPQFVQADSFENSIQDTNIVSNNDVGPKKIRRRFTEPTEIITHTMWMSRDEVISFRDYYKVNLKNGSATFKFIHPIFNVEAEWRFQTPPKYTNLGGNNFKVMMEWMMMPGTLVQEQF